MIINGLISLSEKHPEQINSISNIVKTLATNVWTFVFLLMAIVCAVGWANCIKSKKDLNKTIGELRKKLEQNDPGGRSSSGLNATGETPGE